MTPDDKRTYIIGIDTGGTFTDIVALSDRGQVFTTKAPTTPQDFSVGVMEAVAEMAGALGLSRRDLLSRCTMFKHGTTVATNAVINRHGAKVGFITTRGFEDTTLIGRSILRVDGLGEEEIKHMSYMTKPEPLVPRSLIRGVYERVDHKGNVVFPLDVKHARQQIKSLVETGVEAIGVSLLFAWVNPVHEKKLKELVHKMYPSRNLFLTFSHELAPVLREYGRANTVILNCFVGRTMESYLADLEAKLQADGFKGTFMVMQANGGAVLRGEMAPVRTLSSGPAGGVIATKHMGDLLGHPNVISTDMGGTSFDVGFIAGGFWHYTREPIVARWRLILPMIEVESIGAGGGTIARVDKETRRLLVGPTSAGASPGPACYDMGGVNATVTDANLVLGIVDPDNFLGGKKKLHRGKAEEALRRNIAGPLKMDLIEAAAGIHDVVSSHMADLIRKQVVRTGHTPEQFVLYSYGGAGPIHAAAFSADLGIKKVYFFPTSAVFSAFGIALADVIHTHVSSYVYDMPAEPSVLNGRINEIEDGLATIMAREGFSRDKVEFRRTFHMRYRRQMNELALAAPSRDYSEADLKKIMDDWEIKFEELYGKGSALRQAGMELISIEIDAIGKTVKPVISPGGAGGRDAAAALKGNREVFFPGKIRKWLKTAIYDYDRLRSGNAVEGPAIIETPIATIVVPPPRTATVDQYNNIVMEMA
ncbi:MAG: hydantoinase/oxoprolinase family protein [Chloroflexi bacterium]|nr:hydantoinase/oxoprolinase family protein [Chloroflexota bacterium]